MAEATGRHGGVLEALGTQPMVAEFLERAVAEDRVNHAYLFLGPRGSGQQEAARALASMVLCDQGGCGRCDTCLAIAAGTHPDVHHLSPDSATGYLIEQISQLIEDVQLTPIQGRSKVYVIDDADRLRDRAANALLKTIEEPPSGVILILMAPSMESVLPTIVSRCQSVPFRPVAPDHARAAVRARTGLDDTQAQIALSVTQTPDGAVAFLGDEGRMGRRRLMVDTLCAMARLSPWELLEAAENLARPLTLRSPDQTGTLKAADRWRAGLTEEEAGELATMEGFSSPKAVKERERQLKREVRARELSGIMEVIAVGESLVRDLLTLTASADQPLMNGDVAAALEALAPMTSIEGVLGCLDVLERAREDVAHNVTPRLALEVMLLSLKEELCPPSSR